MKHLTFTIFLSTLIAGIPVFAQTQQTVTNFPTPLTLETVVSPAPTVVETSPGVAPMPLPTPVPTSAIYPPSPCPFSEFEIMRPGASGGNVENLQRLLSQDPSIYPEGLVTGYYGSLTAGAVRRVQQKFGLSQTGQLDQPTRNIIFPCDQQLAVIIPNGGEEWQVGKSYEIQWKIFSLIRAQSDTGMAPIAETGARPEIAPLSYYPQLSIDLLKGEEFYYHIGGVSIYGVDRAFKWTIPHRVPPANDYKIRISSGRNVLPLGGSFDETMKPRALAYPDIWHGWLFDESDSPFSIVGGTPPPVDPELLRKLQELQLEMQALSEQFQAMSNILQNMQDTLKSIIQNLR